MSILRSAIERLAAIPRLPTSAGEQRAAEIIGAELSTCCSSVEIEPEPAYSSYAVPIGLLCGVALVSAWAGARGHRVVATVGGALAAAGIVDDVSGRRMAFRRCFLRPGTTQNVVAVTGDDRAEATLVVLAHHDAAPSGAVFDQRVQEWVSRHLPWLIARAKSNPPLWWPVVAGPALISLGSATGRTRWWRIGSVLTACSLAAMLDIARRPAVPGANDNLSGVAAVLALARALHAEPLRGLRVVLVSAGAEEALQEGIRGFARRHFPGLARDRTCFLNLDTVGSGRLVMLEGEGPIRMHDYDAAFRDLVADCAASEGIELVRGLRSRNSTDGAVPHRHGYRTATLVSVDDRKLIPHYHLDTDLPEHVDLGSVEQAARLAGAVARELAARAQRFGAGFGLPGRPVRQVT
ncbi:M28 family peptidase [Actinoplanes aureus]|uniref:M28 family peptidase n=1 Tax=Actinoplanes aureus TaxID=2792083 RepID=A0A931CK42_9ACTN|nr:M28 family peptidase [Actinoplanes aureus]MBG0568536.1 M28 family peptidase [Actinoplanes aureus]